MTGQADARRTIDNAIALVSSGQIQQAEQLCRKSLQSSPDDVSLLGLLGAILLKRDQHGEAELFLKRAIQLEPAFAKPHEDLGALYLRANKPVAAVSCFETASSLNPNQPSTLFGLATALARSGRQAEADAVQERFLALSPSGRALADAAKLRQEGHADRAEKICGEILSKEPKNIRATRLLAKIASDDGRYAAAEGLLRRILQLAPEFYLGYSDLAEFLVERSRFHEAVSLFEKAIALQPSQATLHRMLADALAIVNKPLDALRAYDRCLELAPGQVHALMGRGHMQRILGERDAAIASYAECTRLKPELGDAWWNLASIKGRKFSASERQTMKSLLDKTADNDESLAALHFALARACEADGDHDEAWRHYSLGNSAKRRTVSYDPVEIETQNNVRIEVFNSDLIRRLSTTAPPEPKPVFIVGMPRSGSTLIEQILASHSHVDGCGELPYVIMLSAMLGGSDPGDARYPKIVADMSPDELRKLGDDYLEHSAAHRSPDAPFFTDKMPGNFLHIGFIHLMLPQAIIIDARRNPLDTCIGNYRQLFAQGKNQSYDLQELGKYYVEYIRIMQHWDSVLPGRILRVQYEVVVNDLETELRRILQHCGLPFEDACLNFHLSSRPVNTASSEQVRQPIYTDAIGFWKNYEPYLDDLKEVLKSVL
ncbi:MAG: sulfotransferase [Gammaproteobacteria bacterium]|nr:sulfotransferase [Gammaproteobacteria bacterium]